MTLPVVVLAGGLGTRLRDVTGAALPKVLVPVLGRPFLDYKLAGLAAQGVSDVELLVGTMSEQVEAHVGDGSRFGLHVRFHRDGAQLLGTGGAVAAALHRLPRAFWVTYGDTFLEFDVPTAEREFERAGRAGLMTVLHNRNQGQPSNALVERGLVVAYRKDDPRAAYEHIDYGMVALTRESFAGRRANERFDLGTVFQELVAKDQLGAFEVERPFHDIGTAEAVRATEEYFRSNETWKTISRAF